MNKIKMLWLLPALALAGCNDTIKPVKFTDFSEVEFVVEVSGESSDGAYVSISHDGEDRDTYYGFVTEDTSSTVDAIVNQKIKELAEDGEDLLKLVKNGTSRVVSLTGLEPKTAYRYVVCGLNTDGTTYGKPGACAFTTAKGIPVLSLTMVGNPTQTNAIVNLTTTGDEDDKWYCFITTDVVTSLATLCKATLAGTADLSSKLQSGNATLDYDDLKANKAYRVVAVGVKDGAMYGTPVGLEFRTPATPVVPELNPNWKIYDAGMGSITTSSGTEYYDHIITCESSSDEDMYFMLVVNEEGLTEYEGDMSKFLSEAVSYMNLQLSEYISYYGMEYVWNTIAYTGGTEKEGYDLDDAGTYYAYAIGVLSDGTASGKYAVSDPIVVEGEAMSESYSAWIGKWNIGDGTVNFDIEIEKNVVEKSYYVTGWTSLTLNSSAIPFDGTFDSSTGNLQLTAGLVASNLSLSDNSGNTYSGYLGFYGADASSVYTNSNTAYTIATAEFASSTKTSGKVAANTVTFSSQSVTFTSASFFFVATTGDVFTMGNMPTFPLTMTKYSTSSTAAPAFRTASHSGRLPVMPESRDDMKIFNGQIK